MVRWIPEGSGRNQMKDRIYFRVFTDQAVRLFFPQEIAEIGFSVGGS